MEGRIKVLLFGLFVLVFESLSGTNYYFSSVSGDDSRTAQAARNPATPWKSIDKFNQIAGILVAGDTVFFKRGETFFGHMRPVSSGTAAKPIVCSAYGQGPKPIISGFHRVQSWTSLGNGIYQSNSLPTGALVNMVLLDGRNYPMGRYPNADADNSGYLSFESHTTSSITDNELSSAINWTGAELVLRTRHWVLDRLLITQHNGQTLRYKEGSTRYPPYDGYGYFIQGHIRTLDQFGEWYYDPDARKIAVYFGNSSPTSVDVRVSAIDVLLEPDVSHVSFHNLSFQGANEWAVFNDKSGREGVRFIQTDFAFIGGNAIEFAGMGNLTISGCSFTDINNLGIDLFYRNPNALIENNVLKNIGVQAGMGKSGNHTYTGIYSTGDGAVIRGNRIINTGYSGINFSGNNVVVENNFLDTFCTILDDGGGIYTFGGNVTYENQRIIGNIILNGKGSPEGTVSREGYYPAEGIYLDNNSSGVEVAYNTVASTRNAGIFIHNANWFNIHDNTIFDCIAQLATANDNGGAAIRNGVIENNIFFGKTSQQLLARHLSIDNDIDEMGQIDNNYYARPFKELEIISAISNTSSNTIVELLDLKEWKERHPYDQNSWKSPVDLPDFTWEGPPEASLIDNGTYDTNILGTSCYSASGDCDATWVSNGILDNGALQISGVGQAYALVECGPVDQSNQYVLSFSAAATEEGIMYVFLRQSGAPYGRLSDNIPIRIGTQRKDYELLISHPVSSVDCRLQFLPVDADVTYWLDNVALFPVSASLTNPDEVIRFEYNDTQTDKMINLGATSYLDVRNQSYSGPLVLEPFTSIILIKDPNGNNEEPGPDPDSDTDANPDGTGNADQPADDTDAGSGNDPDANPDNPQGEPGTDPGNDPDPGPGSDPDGNPNPIFPDSRTGDLMEAVAGNDSITSPPLVGDRGGIRVDLGETKDLHAEGTVEEWSLYPNPVSNWNPELTVRGYTREKEGRLIILDQMGSVIRIMPYTTDDGSFSFTFDTSTLPAGTYYVHRPGSYLAAGKTLPFIVVHR